MDSSVHRITCSGPCCRALWPSRLHRGATLLADACWPAGLMKTCAHAVLDMQSALESTSAYMSLRSPGKLLRMTLFLRSPAAGASFVGASHAACLVLVADVREAAWLSRNLLLLEQKHHTHMPTCGCTAVGNFLGIMLYDALYRLAALVGPAHHFLLKPFPALLFRWDCLVRRSLSRNIHCVIQRKSFSAIEA